MVSFNLDYKAFSISKAYITLNHLNITRVPYAAGISKSNITASTTQLRFLYLFSNYPLSLQALP